MIFNQSLLQGIFPENFKVSKVTPINKEGGEMNPFNYRPISTLSALTQIFEKLICKQLVREHLQISEGQISDCSEVISETQVQLFR